MMNEAEEVTRKSRRFIDQLGLGLLYWVMCSDASKHDTELRVRVRVIQSDE